MPEGSPRRQRAVLDLSVVENARLCDDHYRLTLRCSSNIDAQPGQFVHLRCRRSHIAGAGESSEAMDGPVLLPRPFSIAGLRAIDGGCAIDLIYGVVGPGTTWMAGLRPGDGITALGPLGNAFDAPPTPGRAYVVGGGAGLPPMIWMAERLAAEGHRVVAFCGARTGGRMALTLTGPIPTDASEPCMAAEEFARHGTPIVLATDDGSLGVAGSVVSAMSAYHAARTDGQDVSIVYACGPEPMMRAAATWCDEHGIRCQVCMERMMACGIGTCQSCAVAIRDDAAPNGHVYKLCCTDGPVFDAREVVWELPVPDSTWRPPY